MKYLCWCFKKYPFELFLLCFQNPVLILENAKAKIDKED